MRRRNKSPVWRRTISKFGRRASRLKNCISRIGNSSRKRKRSIWEIWIKSSKILMLSESSLKVCLRKAWDLCRMRGWATTIAFRSCGMRLRLCREISNNRNSTSVRLLNCSWKLKIWVRALIKESYVTNTGIYDIFICFQHYWQSISWVINLAILFFNRQIIHEAFKSRNLNYR